MGDQERIAAARGVIEGFNRDNWEAVGAPLAWNAVYKEIGTGRQLDGREAMVEAWQAWKTALPDATGTVKNAIASGDTVLLEISWEGTQDGPLPGPGGIIPPSGKRQVTPAAFVCTFEGDKIRDIRHYFDMLALLQQLGAMPAPAPA